MIESLFRHMRWETGESMIELHLDRYKIEQENGQTILSFKKGGKWFNLTSKMNELTPQRLEEIIDEVTRTIGTNTDLDMREFLGIVKALTRITGELKNNVSKLTEIDEHLS